MHYADYSYFQHSLVDYQSNCKPLEAFQVFTGGFSAYFMPIGRLMYFACTSRRS